MMHKYWLYGILVNSELQLSALSPSLNRTNDDDTVIIRTGAVPSALVDTTAEGILHQTNSHQYLIEIPNVARYLVSDGREIVVQVDKPTDENAVLLFLQGPVIGALIHQRKNFSVRGSCVATPRGAVIFGGAFGTGKSTLAAIFRQLGYKILADDISVIRLGEDQTPLVFPGLYELKLWRSTLEQLQYPDIETLSPVRNGIDRYIVPIPESFQRDPLPLLAIYIITPVNRNEYAISPLNTIQKLPNITNLIYQRRLALELGSMSAYWDIAATIASQVRIASLYKPIQRFELDPLVSMIQEDIGV